MSTIAPNDPNLVYSPYTWDVTATRAKSINSGAYMRATITGTPTTLAATFDVTNQIAPFARVGFRVDGGSWQDFVIAASIPLSLGTNTWATHTVEMVVIATSETVNRWASPQNTAALFTGLTCDATVATAPTRRRPLRGLALGDSITEGVRTLNANAATDVFRNDSRLSWAHPLGDMLGAEMGIVGFGSVGISKAGAGTVPKFCDSAPYLWSGQSRTYSDDPDFIIANIGTNDNASTDVNVTADTAALLNHWIANTTSPIFVLPGWLQRKASAIQAGIAAWLASHTWTRLVGGALPMHQIPCIRTVMRTWLGSAPELRRWLGRSSTRMLRPTCLFETRTVMRCRFGRGPLNYQAQRAQSSLQYIDPCARMPSPGPMEALHCSHGVVAYAGAVKD